MAFDPKTAPPIDYMRYQERTQDAMREIVRASFALVARDGLIGNHHIHVTFGTRARGVEISQPLREKFPDDMSVVLQHQFAELAVDATQFSVVLWFGNVPERIVVPFAAITSFYDPSVNFALKFGIPANVNRPHGAAPEPAPPALHCGFCGEPRSEERRLVFGRGTCICGDCAGRIAEELRPAPDAPPLAG